MSGEIAVCIPIGFQAHGGGHYFLQLFGDYLSGQGWTVRAEMDADCDILFTNHWMIPRSDILRQFCHKPDLRIVQRIDGSAQDYGRFDDADQRQRAVSELADLVVFQSAYCRHSTQIKFPVIVQDGPVIHNPVDTVCFSPEGEQEDLPGETRVACVTWSTNPFKGAASVYQVAQQNPDITFILCGKYPDAPDLANIKLMGVLDRDQLPRVLRSCHAMLTFSRNEACPNHVLEALASGLPVLYGDSGAMREVIGDCGAAVTVENFRAQFEAVLADRGAMAARARKQAVEQYHPDVIFPRYMDAIQECLQRPLRVPVRRRRWMARLDPFKHPVQFAKRWRRAWLN